MTPPSEEELVFAALCPVETAQSPELWRNAGAAQVYRRGAFVAWWVVFDQGSPCEVDPAYGAWAGALMARGGRELPFVYGRPVHVGHAWVILRARSREEALELATQWAGPQGWIDLG